MAMEEHPTQGMLKPCWLKAKREEFWLDCETKAIKLKLNRTFTSNTAVNTSRCYSRFHFVGKEK